MIEFDTKYYGLNENLNKLYLMFTYKLYYSTHVSPRYIMLCQDRLAHNYYNPKMNFK